MPPPPPTSSIQSAAPEAPDPNNSSVAPCGICDSTVGWDERGVACETCGRWFHASCHNIGTQSYIDLGNTAVNWYCELCHSPNYSSVAFDLHGIEQETFEQFNFSLGSSESFHPAHASTPTHQSQQNKNPNRPLRILNVNFHSAAGKAPEIHHLIQSLRPDVLIGSETWLDRDIASSELFPPEYKVYRKDRNRNGDGVLIAALKTLVTTEEPLLCPHLPCEILWIKIKMKNRRDLLIGSYYRPDDGDEPSQLRMAESLKLACDSRNATVVLGGDFNFPSWDWENSILKSDCSYPRLHRDFKESLEELQLEQIVKTPTRGVNVLDLLVTSHPGLFPRVEIVPGISDHDIVYAELHVNANRVRQPDRMVPCYKKADWEAMHTAVKELTNSILDKHTNHQTTEEVWTDLKDGLTNITQTHIPHVKLRTKRNAPHIKPETLKLIRRRDRIHKKMKRTGRKDLDEEYRRLKRQIQRELRQQYWQYCSTLIAEDEPDKPKPTKKLFSFVKSKKTEIDGVAPLKESGKLVTDNKQKAELLNRQFQSAFSTREDFTEEEFNQRCPMPPRNPQQPLLEHITVSTSGIEKLLRNLDPTKAPGPDRISPRVLRELATELAPAFALLFQASLDTGVVPEDWKTAHVSPVFKKGERYKAENYRPISLTSIPCKLLEHVLVSTIMEYCREHQILCKEQHGFRRAHSCETQLLGLVDEVSKALEDGLQEDLLVLDFSKAFDKVSHSLLVHKLRHLGICGQVNAWIEEFLRDRKQSVVVNGSKSEFAPVESGVPQGSVLGPTLFLLFINDLPIGLTSTARLFADDTACHTNVCSAQEQKNLQEDLNKLATWEEKWKMCFHPQKCTTVHMTRRQTTLHHAYQLHSHTLQEESQAKYLGVTITHDLDWKPHILNITNKANKTLGFIRRNIRLNSKSIKQAAYKALVRPILEYAGTVWDPFTDENIETVEKIQRRAARWVSHRFRQTSSVEEMLSNLEWPTLQTRRKRARLTMFYKIHHGMACVNSQYLPSVSARRRSSRCTHHLHYDVPQSRTDYRHKSFFPRTIPGWNSLPAETVSAPSLAAFQARMARLH